MTAIAAQNLEKNAVPCGKSAANNGRRTTDKYWSLLLILFSIIWIAAARHVLVKLLYHDYSSDDKFDSHVSETKNSYKSNDKFDSIVNKNEDLSDLKNIKIDREYCCGSDEDDLYEHVLIRNKRNSDEAMRSVNEIWGQNWILDMIACNVGFFNENYQRSGSLVVWANVLFCVCLIAYSVTSINTDKMYRAVFPVFGLYFACTIIYRFFYYIRNVVWLGQKSHATLCIWLVPELILFCLVLLGSPFYQRYNRDNGEDEVDTVLRLKTRLIAYTFIIALPSLLFIAPLIVFAFVMYQSNVDNNLLYPFVGIIGYVLLITYYFVSMVISCAIGLALDHDRHYPRIQDFLRAWFIVARYHFGTACCHATIIVPKIKAVYNRVLIMNEEQFKGISNFSAIDRICMMHWKIHDLSVMLTGVRGYDYPQCLRGLLRLSTRESPTPLERCFPGFSQLFRCCSILLIAMNSLLIIGLWACGVMPEPNPVGYTWIIYVLGMFAGSIIGKLYDICADTYWFYSGGKIPC